MIQTDGARGLYDHADPVSICQLFASEHNRLRPLPQEFPRCCCCLRGTMCCTVVADGVLFRVDELLSAVAAGASHRRLSRLRAQGDGKKISFSSSFSGNCDARMRVFDKKTNKKPKKEVVSRKNGTPCHSQQMGKTAKTFTPRRVRLNPRRRKGNLPLIPSQRRPGLWKNINVTVIL